MKGVQTGMVERSPDVLRTSLGPGVQEIMGVSVAGTEATVRSEQKEYTKVI